MRGGLLVHAKTVEVQLQARSWWGYRRPEYTFRGRLVIPFLQKYWIYCFCCEAAGTLRVHSGFTLPICNIGALFRPQYIFQKQSEWQHNSLATSFSSLFSLSHSCLIALESAAVSRNKLPQMGGGGGGGGGGSCGMHEHYPHPNASDIPLNPLYQNQMNTQDKTAILWVLSGGRRKMALRSWDHEAESQFPFTEKLHRCGFSCRQAAVRFFYRLLTKAAASWPSRGRLNVNLCWREACQKIPFR